MTISRAHFPPLLNEIADAAGVEAAMALVRAKGGARVHIPGRAPDGHWLVDLIGREAADKLCAHFRVRDGGSYIKLPLGPKAHYAIQRERVREMLAEAISTDQIVIALGVSRTFVDSVRAATPDQRQGRLF
ncbi:MAG: helix-turn-helix domain-containing protein [Rhodoblastus sp.]